jgi:hypothetical protein
LVNAYIWLQDDHFGCNWNQLHLSFLVERWLQLVQCNSLRQSFDVALQQIFLLQQIRNYIVTNTWLQEQILQRLHWLT